VICSQLSPIRRARVMKEQLAGGVLVVVAVPGGGPRREGDQADPLVVAHRRCGYSRGVGELGDMHTITVNLAPVFMVKVLTLHPSSRPTFGASDRDL
jgi:hypothetical protein